MSGLFWAISLFGGVALLLVPVWAHRVGLHDAGEMVQCAYRRRMISLYGWFVFAVVAAIVGWVLASRPNVLVYGFGLLTLITSLGFVVTRILDGCVLVAECFREGRSARTSRLNLCPNCEYDLAGNESGVCPECGLRFARRERT